ncbi:MAG: (2Fe-2S) ferredoxin domain-containing protein [Labilithrix sp.]|nr:(2Fe-2S) ferredoxin domain-containing protein [Labilithrix sp.]
MRDAPAPRLHLFVCANRREGSPLGPGCGDRGDALYDALKREVALRGEIATTWITKTFCLGICPKEGATVARWPAREASAIVTEVAPTDAAELLDARAAEPSAAGPTLAELARELDALEELQRKKVLDLARRLKPGLTLEDVQNPHDFPELDDPDWHYADGVLAGVQSVKSALSAMIRGRSSGETRED